MVAPVSNTTTEFTTDLLLGRTYVISASGTGGVYYEPTIGSGVAKGYIECDNERKAYTVTPTADETIRVWRGGTLDFQIEETTGASGLTLPGEYTSVGILSDPWHGAGIDGLAYKTTDLSGTTVDGNGVVTQNPGATISPAPRLKIEPAATNYLLNSDAPATQTTASLSTGDYILWVNGTGSAAVTAGTATITGGGTATDGTPDLFTVTGAGTVTVTVTGSLDRFQLEDGSVPTSYIATSGVPESRAADTLDYIAAAEIPVDNETRAVEKGTNVDVDDWNKVVDTQFDSDGDGILELDSIKVYTTGERPA